MEIGTFKISASILWFVFTVIVLFLLRNELRNLFSSMSFRIKTGSSIKIAAFEIGESYVSQNEDIEKKGGIIDTRLDENDIRYKERKAYYDPNRRIFLVHRLRPSIEANQLYDILIYLVPHKDATLACVQKVDYYFGRHWKKRIFTSIDRSRGFSIATSAYGPFVCTAEVYFTDGTSTIIWRYIDFEMGPVKRE